ncbi:MAG: hypothetical protein M0P64_04080 [Candidatus Pacebacteria bacterium]|jgi:hypothetical protein|nr:hypothetical protein [Candidatus Paceibacterota bacterium]
MQQEKIKALIVNIITGAVVLGVIVSAYFVFVKRDISVVGEVATSVADVAKIAEETAMIGTEIDFTVRDLSNLARAVESSNVIFDLPAFKTLQDFTVPIRGESVGRTNPFLPTAWKEKLNALSGSSATPAPKIENSTPLQTETTPQSLPPALQGTETPGGAVGTGL